MSVSSRSVFKLQGEKGRRSLSRPPLRIVVGISQSEAAERLKAAGCYGCQESQNGA